MTLYRVLSIAGHANKVDHYLCYIHRKSKHQDKDIAFCRNIMQIPIFYIFRPTGIQSTAKFAKK